MSTKVYILVFDIERAIIVCDNKYGSEILEYCIKLFEFLKMMISILASVLRV
jgi:hypothetical protein